MRVVEKEVFLTELQNRKGEQPVQLQVDQKVHEIIQKVRENGDQAVRHYMQQYDGVNLTDFVVSQEEIAEAKENIGQSMVEVLHRAYQQIKLFHAQQKEVSWQMDQEHHTFVGQKVTPLDRVGIYIPGGKAAYPSTVLMNAVPAKIAGVEQVVMTTPPQKDGQVNPYVLVAADLAGVDTIYKVGGAQGIAALAYGTETIETVVKIVGPGNAYVASAKKQVFGDVSIDMIAGPSEVCIVTDETTKPAFAAADLLAQAEHDEMASAICLTTSREFSEQLQEEMSKQVKYLSRRDIIQRSIDQQGRIVIVDTLEEAYALVNELAPEHLQLMVAQPNQALQVIRNAGAIFLGQYSPEALGDYYAGPNHTLPTNGTAKYSSPLGVYDFMKKTSVIHYSKEALNRAADDVMHLAHIEGLTAHASSIQIRKEQTT